MAISRIASQDATGTGTTSASATYAVTPTRGNLLIAVTGNDNSATTLANAGWTTVLPIGLTVSNLTTFYKIAGTSEPTVITGTTDAGASRYEIAIYEYQGFTGTPTLDRISFVNTVPTPLLTCIIPATATTTADNELLFAAATWDNSPVQTLSSWSNSFSTRNSVGSIVFTSDQIVSAKGNYSTTCTVTGTSKNTGGVIATFYNSPPSITGINTVSNLTSITF